MKLEKRISPDKTIDQWVLYIPKDESQTAYLSMTPLERSIVDQLREHPEQISTLLKVLAILAAKIEEVQGVVVADDQRDGERAYDG